MALESLSNVLPHWAAWAKQFMSLPLLTEEATYPFPQRIPKFLGVIVQKFSTHSKRPSKHFQGWIDKIHEVIADKLVPTLAKHHMFLPTQFYEEVLGKKNDFSLVEIPDFGALATLSQKYHVPIFALSDEQVDDTGAVLEQDKIRRESFKKIFDELAEQVIRLTRYESSD